MRENCKSGSMSGSGKPSHGEAIEALPEETGSQRIGPTCRHGAPARLYPPLVRREQAQDSALQRMTRKLFGDSPELLMSRLLRKGVLTEDQLRELRELVDKRLRERGEG